MKHIILVLALMTITIACQGPQGETGATGAEGLRGLQGRTIVGPAGPAGLPGENGTDGKDGSNGSTMIPVQFCKGVTPSYPSTFPELGLCFNGDLYGVYSANGGFMVYMPPGTYYSNGINASCTFTVSADCKVQ